MGRSDDVVNVSGHRLGTMEIESSIVSHEYVAEAAVVSYKHEVKGEAIHAFVTLKNNYIDYMTPEFAEDLRYWVKDKIGSIAKPERICSNRKGWSGYKINCGRRRNNRIGR